MYQRIAFGFFLLLVSFSSLASAVIHGTSFAILGQPKYSEDFTHFNYVNPTAPKGGSITFAALGTFDNFNRYASRGNPAARTELLYDTLFSSSDDEIGSYYPLIAKSAHYSSDFSWMEIQLNPNARFQDNSAVTATDVEFSFNKFMQEGVSQFRSFYEGVTVKAIAPLTVRITLPKSNREQMLSLAGGLRIFPQKYWKDHKLDEPLSTPPLSGGAYRISDYKMGQYVTYSRVKDYWAANLPVNVGQNNLDVIRYDYYLDDNVSLEAFKAGAYDIRLEGMPKNWFTQYKGNNFTKGYIVKSELKSNTAQDTRWLAFNIKKPLFSDRRIRQALTLAFDFEWLNKAFYYNAYQRSRSFFQNTDYEAKMLPSTEELKWLIPLKERIPPEVFTRIYQPPVTNGEGYPRENLLTAAALLKQAGWEIRDQQLINIKTGEPFQFELLLLSGSNRQYVLPFRHNLARLGIQMSIREVDASQFLSRLRSRDFDMLPTVYSAETYPQPSLKIAWASEYINSTYNRPGVQDPAIDELIQKINEYQEDESTLLSLGRALDRVLTWNQLMIPLWYSNYDRFAYWNKFSMPAIRPTNSLGLNTWWFDEQKAAQLPAERR